MTSVTIVTIQQVMAMDKAVMLQLNQLGIQHRLGMVLKAVTHKLSQDMVNNNKLMVMIQQVVTSNAVILITICNCNYRWCLW